MVLGDIGSWASILGTVISIFLLYHANKIRKLFLLKARVPKNIKELEKISKNISINMEGWDDDKYDILLDFKKSVAILDDLEFSSNSKYKNEIKDYKRKIIPKRWFFKKNTDISQKEAWALYTSLGLFIQEMTNIKNNSKWD
ncbi:hypothetical protein [Oceanospirillum beijerinckii]|uniref:hypothetical protein n=1 Tax=Oceanospirillum beijerinckii TaxID=64976 RepID=UPI0004827182|nr:hypothetical protein [Oceanospirillum beijerinckii]